MQEKLQDIMRYESNIWNAADDLRGASIKESDWPAYMMPFFALMMLEGRMRNAAAFELVRREYVGWDERASEEDLSESRSLGRTRRHGRAQSSVRRSVAGQGRHRDDQETRRGVQDHGYPASRSPCPWRGRCGRRHGLCLHA